MTDQLYCPTCGPDWHGAYDMNHRCVKCGDPLKAEKVMEKLKDVEEERDALAAHVESLFETFNRIAIEGESGMYSPRELEDALCAIFSDGPDASFARLKAKWQAELLDEVGPGFVDIVDRGQARAIAKALRHRAPEQP